MSRYELQYQNPKKPDGWITTIAVLVFMVITWIAFKLLEHL